MGVLYVSGQLSSFTVGRAPESDLVLEGSFVSRRHLLLTSVSPDVAAVEVCGMNGARITGIQVHKGFKGYVRAGDRIVIGPYSVAWTGDVKRDGNVFVRAARKLPKPDTTPVEIEGPPPRKVPEKPSVMLAAGPALTMAIPLLLGAGRSIAVLSSVFAFIWAAANVASRVRKGRSEEKRRRNTYMAYLQDCEKTIKRRITEAVGALNELYPPAGRYFRSGGDPILLWNADPEDGSYRVRIGAGRIENPVDICIPKERFAGIDDSLKELPGLIRNKYSHLPSSPVRIPLDGQSITVFEIKDKKDIMILAAFIIQIAVSFAPDEVNIVIDAEKKIKHFLRWIAYLPHYRRDIREGEEDKMTVLVTDDTGIGYEYLTKGCRVILALSAAEGIPAGIASVVNRKASGSLIRFDMLPEQLCFSYASTLSGLWTKNSDDTGIPSEVSIGDVTDMPTDPGSDKDHIDCLCRKICADHENCDITASIKAPIGMAAGGRKVELDLHEKAAGPHGLIAGTTGSGKSELLTTIILSFAARYPADKLAFFLVDYKGGGMSNLFSGLPHLLGSISNLSRCEALRAMKALRSENIRRQRIFADCGVNSINDYTRLYDSGAAKIPLPHLLLIVDEFAELKREEPEFMDSLISVAQIGRSLGIHLILATQKPTGVIDEKIRSNSRFRIALRLVDRSDSSDLIGRGDAASIKECGRAYLQVGNDEQFVLFQSAYAMGRADSGNKIRVFEDPFLEKEIGAKETKPAGAKSWYELMLDAIRLAHEKMCVPRPAALWLPKLAESIEDEDAYAVFDNVYMQRYEKAVYDPEKCGHLLITGRSGTGKSELLLSVVSHMDDETAVYVIDHGGGRLAGLDKIPCCGGYVAESEPSDIIRMTGFICDILGARRRCRPDAAKYPSRLVLVIDDLAAVKKEADEEFTEHLTTILTFGKAANIFVVATVLSPGSVREERLFDTYLILGNEDAYNAASLLKVAARDIPRTEDMPGRGVGLWEGVPLEFMAVKAKSITDRAPPGCYKAKRFPHVPATPVLEDLLQRAKGAGDDLPVGFEQKSGRVFFIPCDRVRCMLIAGKPYSGRHTLLFGISITAARYGIKTVRADTYEAFITVFRDSKERKIITVGSIISLLNDFYKVSRSDEEEEEFAACFLNPRSGQKQRPDHNLVVAIAENETATRFAGRKTYESMAEHPFGITLGGSLDEVRIFDYSYLPYSLLQKPKKRCLGTVVRFDERTFFGDVIIPGIINVDNSQSP